MSKPAPPRTPENVEPINLREALEERYLAYALSTIMHRALPDVRDGLKPVHRRLVYAMRLLRLDPASGFKKCARVVGDVIGKFHPHGDQAVYDAMVRLAQDFAVRYPLVEGQGNFGNIDGDNAAAYRYTEARLTRVAMLLLEGIDEDTVDFRETYNGEDTEPLVLPGAFPNLLANGASGIAVGMATSVPPHNAAELCEAALHLIKFPNAGIDKLMQFIPGPDFPTGGIIVDDPQSLRETYTSGRGGVRVRARWVSEDLGRGTWQVVVTEIPYQVQKSRLVEKIAELITDRKLPLVADVRDESAEDIRLILEPRSRSVDPVLMMESLFRLTDLESRILGQHERAGRGPGAARALLARDAHPVARSPQGGAVEAQQLSPRRDCPPAGGAWRLSHRLSQPRRGDPHHPRGGRGQARPHGALRSERCAGRSHPQHAPARSAQAGGA